MKTPVFRSPKMPRFCEIFARLLHEAFANGEKRPKVGRKAALLAGYGENSWNENKTLQAADVLYARLIRRPDVLAYLKQLGVERLNGQWRTSDAA
jgi:hypothetical protein